MKYIYSIDDNPDENDYYYEATKTTNYHFPKINAHSHCYYEIYVLLAGDIRLKIDDTIHDVMRGDILVIPPHIRHQLLPVDDNYDIIYDRMYLYLTKPCLQSFDFNNESIYSPLELAAQNKQYLFHIREHNDYNTILDCMLSVYKSKTTNPPERELMNRANILKLMTLLTVNIKAQLNYGNGSIGNPLFLQIAEYINQHYTEGITLESLSSLFYVNKQTLARGFKKQFNMPIHEFQNKHRIEIAKEKMLDGLSSSEASYFVGFSDYSTFYRAFQKMEGMSPKDFIKSFKDKS